MKIKKSILKLFSLGCIITFFILIINYVSKDTYKKSYIENIIDLKKRMKDSSYFFIGSSRVKRSIDPKEVKKIFKNRGIINLGINSSVFISNCLLTESIMKIHNGVFFIELSPALFKLSNGIVMLSNEINIDIENSAKQLFQKESSYDGYLHLLKIYKNKLSSELAYELDYKRKIRSLFFDDTEFRELPGFISIEVANNINSISSFLTYNELVTLKKTKVNLDNYKIYINHLMDLSVKYKSKIVFFLPLTYKKKEERDIVIPLYQMLPDSMKIKYSEKFLNEITNSDYLQDIIHLNSNGAKVYSQWLGKYLNENSNKFNN